MIYQITINANNELTGYSIGGYIENGINVTNIPAEVQACPKKYKYINGEIVLNTNYISVLPIADIPTYLSSCSTINLSYQIVNNCYYIFNNQTAIAVHCANDTPFTAETLSASAELHIESLKNIIKENKISQIKLWCENTIIAGFDCDVLGRGNLHYSLSKTKQDDLKVLYQNIQLGVTAVLWHDDSRVMHEIYTAEQFTNLFNYTFAFTIQNKIYSDGLEQYVIDLASNNDYTTLNNIVWGATLPAEIQTQVDAQINLMIG